MRWTWLLLLGFVLGSGALQAQSVPHGQKMYLSAEGGWAFVPEWGVGHYAQVSLGYQLHDWLGFGLSAGDYAQYSMYLNQVRGAAVHYRARPGQWRIN